MEWISVDDRLPKNHCDVLVIDDLKIPYYAAVAWCIDGKWFLKSVPLIRTGYYSESNLQLNIDVAYWCEIPGFTEVSNGVD